MIRVLIVEDDPMVAEINRRYLASVEGFICVGTAGNVDEAEELLKHHPVDLVLLDLFMPGKNGLEFLTNIRLREQGIDVIVISAASDIPNIKAALRLGAVDYLIKPFEFRRFRTALETYRREQEWMVERVELSQEELDRRLLNPDPPADPPPLPKGLTRETLERVTDRIQSMGTTRFSTEELARKVGISRVSVRKYLKFLKEIGLVVEELEYRSTGRPGYRYQWIKANHDRLDPFLKASE